MNNLKSYRSFVMKLYSRSFSSGVGSVISVSGNYFPVPDLSHDQVRDAEAIRSDWEAVGDYIKDAYSKLRY